MPVSPHVQRGKHVRGNVLLISAFHPLPTTTVTARMRRHMLVSFLSLALAGQPASAGDGACDNPAKDDMRPYTLCLAETWFDDAEVRMNRQLRLALAHVRKVHGPRAARRLAYEQRRLVKRRDAACETEWADSPVTQVSRNILSCEAQWSDGRTRQLKALAVAK